MADSITSNLNLIKPEIGASRGTWGSKLNQNFDILDTSIAARMLKSGGQFTGAVGFTLGSAALPSLYFESDSDTGIYSAGANSLNFSTGGALRLTVDASGATFVSNIAVNGSNLFSTSNSFNLLNTNVQTLNFASAATSLNIAATSGTTTIRNNVSVGGTLSITGNASFTGDLALNGGDLTTTSANATLFPTNAASILIGGDTTNFTVGSSGATLHNLRGTGAVKVPVGSTGQRPTGVSGYLRYNTTLNIFEGYSNGAWGAIGAGATGGAGNYIFFENEKTVTANYTVLSTKNAMSAGPISIANGVTVTIENGARWVIV